MKLILVDYLASLKERGELDAIIPDLLSEKGFSVLSRPAIGTRQFGVDAAAVGPDSNGVKTLFLLTIKSGHIKRRDWDAPDPQALRPSLNEIVDVYIKRHVLQVHRTLPICIVICLGGEVDQAIEQNVLEVTKHLTTDRIKFKIWNGDFLANMLLGGVLREKALPKTWQSDFRKSLALVDEPDASYRHFCRLLSSVFNKCDSTKRARLTAIRQINVAVWTLYVWARQADNIEVAYLASERAMLVSWQLIKDSLIGKSKLVRQLNDSFERLNSLHKIIANDYISTYVGPRSHLDYGLSAAVPSQSSLDINLRLFDIVGRIGSHGLWLLHELQTLEYSQKTEVGKVESTRKQLDNLIITLTSTLSKNPVLQTPIKDRQVIDINIACLFLHYVGQCQVVQWWIKEITNTTQFAYFTHCAYPCIHEEYRDLMYHPIRDEEYRISATAGSLLVPTLAVWSAITQDKQTLCAIARFASRDYSHSTIQLWYPGTDTEDHLYINDRDHGLETHDFEIERNHQDMLNIVESECTASPAFMSLSVHESGFWPLLISASRHYRVPVPPHFWPVSDWSNKSLKQIWPMVAP